MKYCTKLFTATALVALSLIIMNPENASAQKKQKVDTEYSTASGLKYKFIKLGNGIQAQVGDLVEVHYVGKLTNDSIFDSSIERGEPIKFKLGVGQVIKGWDEGIALLHVGDKAMFTIPPSLGYGDQDMGVIPPKSTLLFEVELIKVIPAAKPYDTKGKDTLTTKSGLKYIIIEKGKGIEVNEGMNVTVHYTGYFEDMKVFDSSVERGEAITIPIGKGKVIKGWDEGIALLKVGDKARLWIPYNLAYGETAKGPIPAKANLLFDVEIIDAKEIVKPVAYDVKGKDTLTTASGLKYIIVTAGTGEQASSGKSVKVHYTGYFTDGKIFDSSVERAQAFGFTLGAGQVIKGWDEGIALLKVGGKARLIIPYQLAYGEAGRGPIPAKATLIFDVELLEVK